MRSRRYRFAAAVLVGFSVGLVATTVSSSEPVRSFRPISRVVSPPMLEPVRALPRTSLVAAMFEAQALLEGQRPWSAWQVIEPHLEAPEATPRTRLLAARAAAGWGGWEHVTRLLNGQEWLDRAEQGEGWRLLAQAHEAGGRWNGAAEAYRRYLEHAPAAQKAHAAGRLAAALQRGERPLEAADAFRTAAAGLPEIADWLRVLETEALLAAGVPDTARLMGTAPSGSRVARLRRARAEAATWLAVADSARAAGRIQYEIRILAQQGAAAEAATLSIELARLHSARGEAGEARDLLQAVAWETSLPDALRVRAANLLGEQPEPREAATELARAAAYEAAGRSAQAARSLRTALAGGAPDDAASRLRLGRLLFAADEFAGARTALLAAAEGLPKGEALAEAELLAARARFRGGDRTGGLTELRRVAERRPGTAAAGSALFLLADAATRVEEAIPLYRRAAAVTAAPEAREALFRLGDRSLRAKDAAGALRAWEEYVARYPTGEATARLALSVGAMHERAGRRARAGAMFAASMAADPLSYYAVRAGERLGTDPLAPVLAAPHPWPGLAVDASEAGAALERLDLLRELGLEAEWREEWDGTIRRFERRPLALLTLAEGARDRGHILEAIRLGRRLLEERHGQWDERLLRVVFPLPFRDLLEREADRYGIDAMLFAGLVRQESTFRPAVRSRVGATGLAQIMPPTGRWLAPRVGIAAPQFEDRLLTVPEVNLRMGALYLSDLLKRYGGAADLALAGYNAGPGRADRWRRELGHDRDVDAFREAIPFNETRHYVKIVLRNALVYERLYHSPRDFSGGAEEQRSGGAAE